MSRMTPARIQARERRLAAIHEAGHFVIAVHHRAKFVDAAIWPTGETDPSYKTWVGQCSMNLSHLSGHRRAMIGAAGMIAESIWNDRAAGDISCSDAFDVWDLFQLGVIDMSDTDWGLAGLTRGNYPQWLFKAVVQCWKMLDGKLYADLLATARRLIQEGALA